MGDVFGIISSSSQCKTFYISGLIAGNTNRGTTERCNIDKQLIRKCHRKQKCECSVSITGISGKKKLNWPIPRHDSLNDQIGNHHSWILWNARKHSWGTEIEGWRDTHSLQRNRNQTKHYASSGTWEKTESLIIDAFIRNENDYVQNPKRHRNKHWD